MQKEIQKDSVVLDRAAKNKPKSIETIYNLLNVLNREYQQYLEKFFSDKRTSNVSSYDDRCTILQRANESPDDAARVILNNYGFRINTRFRKTPVIEIDLPPCLQKLAIVSGEYKFVSGNFRDPNWVKTGTLGEVAFIHMMNCALHFLNLKPRISMVDTKSLLYSGDGGNDLNIGNSKLDIKYRDDNPSKGMALQRSFLESSLRDSDVLLVQMSNVTNDKKLGHSVVNTPINKICKDLPIALVGYVSVLGYNQRKQNFDGFSDFIVDDLDSPSELVVRLLKEVNEDERYFEI